VVLAHGHAVRTPARIQTAAFGLRQCAFRDVEDGIHWRTWCGLHAPTTAKGANDTPMRKTVKEKIRRRDERRVADDARGVRLRA
jgi:hypothetical protein